MTADTRVGTGSIIYLTEWRHYDQAKRNSWLLNHSAGDALGALGLASPHNYIDELGNEKIVNSTRPVFSMNFDQSRQNWRTQLRGSLPRFVDPDDFTFRTKLRDSQLKPYITTFGSAEQEIIYVGIPEACTTPVSVCYLGMGGLKTVSYVPVFNNQDAGGHSPIFDPQNRFNLGYGRTDSLVAFTTVNGTCVILNPKKLLEQHIKRIEQTDFSPASTNPFNKPEWESFNEHKDRMFQHGLLVPTGADIVQMLREFDMFKKG